MASNIKSIEASNLKYIDTPETIETQHKLISFLCKAYSDILDMRRHSEKEADTVYSLKALEVELQRLLGRLAPQDRLSVASEVLLTFQPALYALLPEGDEFSSVDMPITHFQFLIDAGPQTFGLAVSKGLAPSYIEEEFEEAVVSLMKVCAPKNATAWRDVTRLYFKRALQPLTSYLWYARESAGDLSPALSVFLSQLIQEQVDVAYENGANAFRRAMAGGDAFDIAALFIAGFSMPESETLNDTPGREVLALLDACASSHGRLEVIATHGPLESYIARGESPDYR